MIERSDKLKVRASGDREVVMTREFDAPRALVFAAHTRPELLRRWLGVMDGWSWETCTVDLRVGGTARFVWKGPDGMTLGLTLTYREIVVPERLVAAEVFDQSWYEGEAVGTVEFVENDGRTTLTQTMVYASREAREAVLRTPMAEGVGAGLDQLEALVATMAAPELDPPEVVTTEGGHAALLAISVPRREIQSVMGGAFGELAQTLAAQKLPPAGPFYAFHHRMDPDVFTLDLAVPVGAAVRAEGRVRPGERPVMRVVRTVYHGPYEGLGSAWGAFRQWIHAQGMRATPSLWETYLAGPESVSDPKGYRTELNQPLAE